MDPVRSLYYIGPQMGHVTMFCTCCILGRAPHTKETLYDFLLNYGSGKGDTIMWHRVTRHPQVFRELTVGQRWVLGCHSSAFETLFSWYINLFL